MRIRIFNGTSWQRHHTKAFLVWFEGKYLQTLARRDLVVTVKIYKDRKNISKDDLAYCDHVERNHCVIEIYAPANMTYFRFLTHLAHESVHMKQYFTGELRDTTKGTVYNRKLYPDDGFDYWNAEWEVEAMGREMALTKLYAHEAGIYEAVFTRAVKAVVN